MYRFRGCIDLLRAMGIILASNNNTYTKPSRYYPHKYLTFILKLQTENIALQRKTTALLLTGKVSIDIIFSDLSAQKLTAVKHKPTQKLTLKANSMTNQTSGFCTCLDGQRLNLGVSSISTLALKYLTQKKIKLLTLFKRFSFLNAFQRHAAAR